MRARFSKSERLCSKKILGELFRKGSAAETFYLFPFRVLYLPYTSDPSSDTPLAFPSIVITVSKRQFKHAVDRNRIRRRIREAYRLHKPQLLREGRLHPPPAHIAFLYTAKTILTFEEIEKGMKLSLQKL